MNSIFQWELLMLLTEGGILIYPKLYTGLRLKYLKKVLKLQKLLWMLDEWWSPVLADKYPRLGDHPFIYFCKCTIILSPIHSNISVMKYKQKPSHKSGLVYYISRLVDICLYLRQNIKLLMLTAAQIHEGRLNSQIVY